MHKNSCVCDLNHNCLAIAVDGQEIKFDAGWSKFTGISQADLSEKWLEVIHPEDKENCVQWLQALKNQDHQQFEFRARRHDGQYRSLLADFVCDDAKGVKGVVATFIDITEKKELEYIEKRQHDIMCSLTDSVRAVLGYVDLTRKFIYVNNGFRSVLGSARHTIYGSLISDVFSEQFPHLPEKIEEAFHGTLHHSIENLSSGTRFCFSILPDYDDGSKVKGVFVFAVPVDEKFLHESLVNTDLFVECWKKDPPGFCRFIGNAIARIGSRNLPDLYFSIATSYYSHQQICRRVDFLYSDSHHRIGGQKGKALAKLVSIEQQNGIVCLHDEDGIYGYVRVMLLREDVFSYQTYGAYCFVDSEEKLPEALRYLWDQESCGIPYFNAVKASFPGNNFWNFRNPEDLFSGVIVCPDCCGFYDLQASKNIADLICSCSNFAGFLE